MLVHFQDSKILDVAFYFNHGQGKHRCPDNDTDVVKTKQFLTEVNYVAKNYKVDKKIYTDMIPSHDCRVFECGPLPQGLCFRQCVNGGKTHNRCSNHFIDVSIKTRDTGQIKH